MIFRIDHVNPRYLRQTNASKEQITPCLFRIEEVQPTNNSIV